MFRRLDFRIACGGGGGPQGGYGFGFGIAPALETVFRILIQAFFILLYGIYVDRQAAQLPQSTT